MKSRRSETKRRAVDFRLFREYLNLSTTAQNRLTHCHCNVVRFEFVIYLFFAFAWAPCIFTESLWKYFLQVFSSWFHSAHFWPRLDLRILEIEELKKLFQFLSVFEANRFLAF